MSTTDPTVVRQRLGSAAIVAFFGVLLGSAVAAPTDSHSNTDLLRAAASHPTAMQITAWLEIAAGMLAPVVVLTLAAAIRRRGAALGHLGSVLGVAGAAGTTLIGVHTLFVVALAQRGGVTQAAVLDRLDQLAPAVIVLFFALPVALVLLAGATVRAGIAPRWILPAAIVFLVLDQLHVPAAEFVQLGIGLLTFGYLAYRINAMNSQPHNEPALRTPPEAVVSR